MSSPHRPNRRTGHLPREARDLEPTVSTYHAYAARLDAANALDFDDLIMRTVSLLQNRPAVAEMYRRRFRHVLVDEYQDTNYAQHAFLSSLFGSQPDLEATGSVDKPVGVTAVGDPMQSIYGFRGASPGNLYQFLDDF